ncbi:MAG: fumarylacetoacetase [Frankiaceae bacterium]
MSTWVPVPEGSDFPIDNLPYGTFREPGAQPSLGVAIGDAVLDVTALGRAGLLPADAAASAASLDRLLAAGRPIWSAVRARVGELLREPAARDRVQPLLHEKAAVQLLLPFRVGDYVDFYSSLEHATNLGRLFRPGSEPLLPNWRHLPVGYHGRAGTVVISDTPIRRPRGQRKPPDAAEPVFGPTERLDIEAEVGFVIGAPSRLGEPVAAADAAEHVFGLVLVNDWSARDLQAWEYQPLGPFLGKSFATTVSPWVVPLEALAGARVPAPAQSPPPLPYLRSTGDWAFDLTLEVNLNGTVISRPPYAGMYWTIPQQLAHATSNGAALRTGDLFASGTVSGPAAGQQGSLIELTRGGTEALELGSGETRTFLLDGDVVTLGAHTARGPRFGFGSCAGTVTPSGP